MLGLVNTVSSTSTPESKYSITLDGTDDHINLGDNLDLGTDDFSISLWAKFADATGSTYFIAKNQDGPNRIRIFLHTDDKIKVTIEGGDNVVTNTAGASAVTALEDTWVHICVTCDRDGDIKLYVNGSTSTYGFSVTSGSSSQSLDNTAPWIIGAISPDGNFFTGKIAELAIWNVALDANNVAAIYNSGRPTNLNINSGNYIKATSLQAYYRMGNGTFDDKANGVVHDQHAPGYGGELVNDGGFPTGTTAWLKDTGWSLGDGVANGNISGGLVFLYQEDVGITSNKTYKANIEVKTLTSGSVNFYYFNGSFINVASNLPLGPHTFYFTATGSPNGSIYIGTGSFVGSVTNVSVKQLNGFPGITSGGPTFTSDTP